MFHCNIKEMAACFPACSPGGLNVDGAHKAIYLGWNGNIQAPTWKSRLNFTGVGEKKALLTCHVTVSIV